MKEEYINKVKAYIEQHKECCAYTTSLLALQIDLYVNNLIDDNTFKINVYLIGGVEL